MTLRKPVTQTFCGENEARNQLILGELRRSITSRGEFMSACRSTCHSKIWCTLGCWD